MNALRGYWHVLLFGILSEVSINAKKNFICDKSWPRSYRMSRKDHLKWQESRPLTAHQGLKTAKSNEVNLTQGIIRHGSQKVVNRASSVAQWVKILLPNLMTQV